MAGVVPQKEAEIKLVAFLASRPATTFANFEVLLDVGNQALAQLRARRGDKDLHAAEDLSFTAQLPRKRRVSISWKVTEGVASHLECEVQEGEAIFSATHARSVHVAESERTCRAVLETSVFSEPVLQGQIVTSPGKASESCALMLNLEQETLNFVRIREEVVHKAGRRTCVLGADFQALLQRAAQEAQASSATLSLSKATPRSRFVQLTWNSDEALLYLTVVVAEEPPTTRCVLAPVHDAACARLLHSIFSAYERQLCSLLLAGGGVAEVQCVKLAIDAAPASPRARAPKREREDGDEGRAASTGGGVVSYLNPDEQTPAPSRSGRSRGRSRSRFQELNAPYPLFRRARESSAPGDGGARAFPHPPLRPSSSVQIGAPPK